MTSFADTMRLATTLLLTTLSVCTGWRGRGWVPMNEAGWRGRGRGG